MNITTQAYDTHGELLIKRYKNGIELVKPRNNTLANTNSIASIGNMDAGLFFLDTDSKFVNGNQGILSISGANSIPDCIGRDTTEFLSRNYALEILADDKCVMQSKEMRISQDTGRRKDGSLQDVIGMKFPWYYEDAVIGLFGFCINIDQKSLHNFAKTMTAFMSVGLLGPARSLIIPEINEETVYFSKREKEILEYILIGKTAREISVIFSISIRTVEHHLENIKQKSGCSNKFDLFLKFSHQLPA